ncbi:MAG: hypothetical protein A3G39_09575 [Deltaproteobacteria bacterium RIFCSPLOWO2_12_FULL_43_16]|nr:MAG: hypothetical protein A3D30_03040 [Deltaproteobacteria bacterium RIFCSPHIGHO2_02_FULL_43_33]OGQ39836.1 MAG: hypothetical protein A3A85_04455 [Deltaproteobacteria bacterium RIFCSPLOWO2_01_FULL_42_9]OGQ59117.1 MAG: hypothetical protein A3G39_09575 [Deltaproteobacteria bacterium RIFCSPLOWO2_12_FULL_43_16]HBR16000.1 hypothetical protein [Deltaproteobacteria bacterium]
MSYRAILMLLTFFFALISPLHTIATSHGAHNLWRILKPASPERFLVFEASIMPWIKKEFANNKVLMSNGSVIKRGLVRSDLLRFENIEGQDRYNVHIEYRVFIKDVSGTEIAGLKGQEIVFLVNDGMVEDYFPFDEYWIEGTILDKEEFY